MKFISISLNSLIDGALTYTYQWGWGGPSSPVKATFVSDTHELLHTYQRPLHESVIVGNGIPISYIR